jgi:D-alanyl-lipoteichoic acid acyltransferase DltB (MBOAT superfamily)
MLLGGLWHGAAWTFVIWGGLHGITLAIHRARGAYEPSGRPREPTVDDVSAIAGTFLLVSFLWVFFRAESFAGAIDFLGGFTSGVAGARAGAWKSDLILVALMGAAMFAIDLLDRRRVRVNPLVASPAWAQGAVAGIVFVSLLIWSGQTPTPFIYFQF